MKNKKTSGVHKSAVTWTVRGVEPETKTAAHMAARRAGLPVGKWLNRVIRDAATEDMKAAPPPAAQLEDTLAALVQQMQADREQRERQAAAQQEQTEAMNARLSAMEAREQEAESTSGGFFARLYGALRSKD